MPVSTAEPALDREIRFGPYRYDYHVRAPGAGNWDEFSRLLTALDADRFVLITDAGVPPAIRETTAGRLAGAAPSRPVQVTVPAEETAKNILAVGSIADEMISQGVTRQSVIVALGGGCVGNIAGVTAATIYRGIRLVHVPTTLLAMSDSVLSLKQAVNSGHGKNHLGTFYAPLWAWCDLGFLESLPADEFRCALCEACKNVLAILPGRYGWALEHLRPGADYSVGEILAWIELCVAAKTTVMRDDPQEKFQALVLEYGHTVGHIVELMTGGRIRHGYAIALGMLAEARAAQECGWLAPRDMQAHRDLLAAVGCPRTLPPTVPTGGILGWLPHDNKRGYLPPRPGFADMVQLQGLGRPLMTAGRALAQVPVETIAHAIDAELRSGGTA